MLKADIGDILYIIIFAVLMLAGGVEKYVKAKRQQQQDRPPRLPQSYGGYEDGEEQPAPKQASPQTLEEMMKRMLQTTEMQKYEEEEDNYPEEAQSLEVIPETPVRNYQPIVSQITSQSGKGISFPVDLEEEKKESEFYDYEFDIRQAIIASEILNRKY